MVLKHLMLQKVEDLCPVIAYMSLPDSYGTTVDGKLCKRSRHPDTKPRALLWALACYKSHG